MAPTRFLLHCLIASCLLCAAPWSLAQTVFGGAADTNTVRIGEISLLERQYMNQQREEIDQLARRHLGSGFLGQRERDVALLQRLLDAGLVANDDTVRLQAMGMILGDLMAEELGMHWVVYEDSKGRSRALRYRDTEHYLFPVTMISRLREAGNMRPVAEIYARAQAYIESVRPRRPFE